MIDDYFKAKRMADRSIRRAVLEGRYPYLSDLDSKPGMSDTLSCIDLGIKEIPILTEKGIISAQVAHSLNEYYINKLAELEKPSAPKTEAAPPQNLDPAFSELTTIQKPSKKSEQVTAPVHSPAPARAKKTSKLSVSVILTIIASVLISFGIKSDVSVVFSHV